MNKKVKTKEEKRWFRIKLISSITFLVVGLIIGIISLYANGWNFVTFISDPTVDLVLLIIACLFVFTFTSNFIRRI